MKMNLAVRFKNPQFVIRFVASLLIPALASIGIEWQSLTTWAALGDALIQIVSNPVVIAMIIVNALNVFPDPVVKGISDSDKVMRYERPSDNAKKIKR